MPLTAEQVDGLGVALNEAGWHDLTIDEASARVEVLLAVLARDDDGRETADPRRTLVLSGVSRVAASCRVSSPTRQGDEEVLPLDGAGLRELLRRGGGGPIYGWEFIDADQPSWARWRDRLSLDVRPGGAGGHHLDLFQELHGKAVLDLRVWFHDLAVLDSDGTRVPVDTFIAAGARWWEAMYAGERSDLAPSIVPSRPEPVKGRWRTLFRRTPR